MPNSVKDIQTSLARALVSRKVSDEAIKGAAATLAKSELQIRGIDICTHGICLDYVIDDKKWWELLPRIVNVPNARLRGIEIFPWGIPFPDIFHIKVRQEIGELAGEVAAGGVLNR